MDKYVFLNDDFVTNDKAVLHIYDHGFMYGDGIFEGIRVYGGIIFKCKEHVARLYRGLKALHIAMPYNEEEFAVKMKKLVELNEVNDAYLRVTVSRGVSLGLDPKKITTPPTIVISTDKLSLYPQSAYDNGLTAVTVSTRIGNPQVVENRIKATGKYLINIQAKLEANMVGAGEGLMLTEQGYVGECTGDNIFFVKNGKIFTPAAFLGILEGITRSVAIEVAHKLGYEVTEGIFTRFDLYTADEVFLTGTAAEVIPLAELDSRVINDGKPGEITKKMIAGFRQYVKDYRY